MKSPEGRKHILDTDLAYIGHDFRMEAAIENRWSVTVSDLRAWTYARETLFFFFFFSRTTVCPFGMADGLNRLRVFIIYTVFFIKKKNCKIKSSVASAASSLALHGLPKADHCRQRGEYRTRNSETGCSIPSHWTVDSSRQSSAEMSPKIA